MTVCTSAPFNQKISKNSQGDLLLTKVHIDQEESISRTPGPVSFLLPDFDDLQRQLQQVETKLKGTRFKAEFDFQSHHADITDPWGQHFSIAERPSNSTGNNKGSFEGLLLPCHVGTAKAIAQFYRKMLQVRPCIALSC